MAAEAVTWLQSDPEFKRLVDQTYIDVANEQGLAGARDSDNGFFFHATNVHPNNLNTYNLDELQQNAKFAAFLETLHSDIKNYFVMSYTTKKS